MIKHGLFQKLTVGVVLVATVLVTTPVSAAELTAPKAALGSVSSVGSVQLRGVSISQEGTFFAGDQLTVGSRSGAKVAMVNGQKIVLDQFTHLTFAEGGQIHVTKGNVAFSGKSASLNVVAGNYEIKGDSSLSGNIAYVGTDYVGLRVNTGNAVVHNLKTNQTYKVGAGQERIFSLTTGNVSTPIAQLASSIPAPIPAAPPAPQMSAGGSLTRSGWIALFATAGGAAALIGVLATRGSNEDDTAAQQANTQVQAVQASAAQATTTANSVASIANTTAAVAALPPAARATAQSLQSAAAATALQIGTLTASLNLLASQLVGASPETVRTITAQIETIRLSLNSEVGKLNIEIEQLNTLLRQNPLPGVPTTVIPTVPPAPPPASSSSPA